MTEWLGVPSAMAGSAAKAVGEALKPDESTKQALTRLAESSPDFQNAALLRAQRIAITQAVLLRAVGQVARWLGRGAESQPVFEDLADKTSQIPVENLTDPKPSVAIPALEGLMQSLSEPDLREMYLNLLATAYDDRRPAPHPSFARIIQNLAPAEAASLQRVLDQPSLPIVRGCATVLAGGGTTVLINHILPTEVMPAAPTGQEAASDEVPVHSQAEVTLMVENWIRLGLIEVDYSSPFAMKSRYDCFVDHPLAVKYDKIEPTLPPPEHPLFAAVEKNAVRLDLERGRLIRTYFGTEFWKSVMPPTPGDLPSNAR